MTNLSQGTHRRPLGLGHHRSALILFSGGQDSTTCLGWALDRFERVETLGVEYGQRHDVEMTCRRRVLEAVRMLKPEWDERLGEDHVLDLSVLGQVSECALTREKAIEFEEGKVPNTFVPGRNLLFFTLAAALGYRRGIDVLVGGMCETDYSGYADCRDSTMKSLQVTLGLGLDRPVVIETPLMWKTKGETWAMASEAGGDAFVDLILEESHTCYAGDHTHRHAWGYGCGECPACRLREHGWNEWLAMKAEENE